MKQESEFSSDKPQRDFKEVILIILMGCFSVGFFVLIRDYLLAVVLAFIFSALLRPIYQWVLRKTGERRYLSSLLVLMGSILFVGVPLAGVASLVTVEAVDLSESTTAWVKSSLGDDAQLWTEKFMEGTFLPEDWRPYLDEVTQRVGEVFSEAVSLIVSALSKIGQRTVVFFLNLFVMLYAMFFFLMHVDDIKKSVVEYLPLSREDGTRILERGLDVTRATLKGLLVIGVLQGVLMGAAFALAGVKGAALWGCVVFVFSAIPSLGTPLVWGPAAIYLFLDGRPVAAILLAVWGGLIVGSVDNVLRPRLIGQGSRLPDLLVMVSSLGGITAFGPIGLLLGPVVAGVFVTTLDIYKEVFLGRGKEELDKGGDGVGREAGGLEG